MEPLEEDFPGLRGRAWSITSPPTRRYNCIAWAASDDADVWWPDAAGRWFWPAGLTRVRTLDAFRDAFATLGYVVCDDVSLDPGFEKVALFADHEGPTHAARQLPNGRWTSKLGRAEDVEHDLRDVEGQIYGSVRLVLKRPRPSPT
jgi:hypothetical protein